MQMKRLFALSLSISILALGSCADEGEKISGQEVGEHLQRGVSGQGQLGGIDRTDDPYVKQGNSQPPPEPTP
jgi:hypothetical protein